MQEDTCLTIVLIGLRGPLDCLCIDKIEPKVSNSALNTIGLIQVMLILLNTSRFDIMDTFVS